MTRSTPPYILWFPHSTSSCRTIFFVYNMWGGCGIVLFINKTYIYNKCILFNMNIYIYIWIIWIQYIYIYMSSRILVCTDELFHMHQIELLLCSMRLLTYMSCMFLLLLSLCIDRALTTAILMCHTRRGLLAHINTQSEHSSISNIGFSTFSFNILWATCALRCFATDYVRNRRSKFYARFSSGFTYFFCFS